jgi:hypothetical protein
MTMQDVQKQEASRSKGSKSSHTSQSETVGIAFVSQGAARESTVADLIAKIEPLSGGISTFLTKREC